MANVYSRLSKDFALCLSVCLFIRHLEYLNYYLHENKIKSKKSKETAFAIPFKILFLVPPTSTTYYNQNNAN